MAFSGSGSGTPQDPYVITNVYQLQEMQDDLSAHYILGNDIDASETITWNNGQGFAPIGNFQSRFTGTLDGRGHVIDGLYIRRLSVFYTTLIGYLQNGQVRNLKMRNVNLTGYSNIGGVVGRNEGGVVENCSATGVINAQAAQNGGVVGLNTGLVKTCRASVTLTSGSYVGGVVGLNLGGTVETSYAMDVNIESPGLSVGGLVGQNTGTVTKCFATGSVSGGAYVGGLIGENNGGTLSYSYSAVSVSSDAPSLRGGLVAVNTGGTVSSCYWDQDVSGVAFSDWGTGKTTSEMMQAATYEGWDFDADWWIEEGASYPQLWAFGREKNTMASTSLDVSVSHLLEVPLIPETLLSRVSMLSVAVDTGIDRHLAVPIHVEAAISRIPEFPLWIQPIVWGRLGAASPAFTKVEEPTSLPWTTAE